MDRIQKTTATDVRANASTSVKPSAPQSGMGADAGAGVSNLFALQAAVGNRSTTSAVSVVQRVCDHPSCTAEGCKAGEVCGNGQEEEDYTLGAGDLVEGANEYVELPSLISAPFTAQSAIESGSEATTSVTNAISNPSVRTVTNAVDSSLGALDALGVPLVGTAQHAVKAAKSTGTVRREQEEMARAQEQIDNPLDFAEQGRAQPVAQTQQQLEAATRRRDQALSQTGGHVVDSIATMVPYGQHLVGAGRMMTDPERRRQVSSQATQAVTNARAAMNSDYEGDHTPLPMYQQDNPEPEGYGAVVSGGLRRAANYGQSAAATSWDQLKDAGSSIWNMMPSWKKDNDDDPGSIV